MGRHFHTTDGFFLCRRLMKYPYRLQDSGLAFTWRDGSGQDGITGFGVQGGGKKSKGHGLTLVFVGSGKTFSFFLHMMN